MPQEDATEIKALIAALNARIDTVLTGRVDDSNHYHPGLLQVQADQGRRIAELEGNRAQALTWKTTLSLSAIGAVVAQALSWLKDHVK